MILIDDFNSLSKEVGFLANLESAVRERLVNIGNFETKERGDYLSVQGHPHSKMSLIISGQVSVKIRANGESLTVMNLGPSDVVGEMSIIDPKKASATARVVSNNAQLWQISADEFTKFLLSDQHAGFKIMKELAKILCNRIRLYNEQMLRHIYDVKSLYLEQDC
jgi:CRP-like cAMP-binding protein